MTRRPSRALTPRFALALSLLLVVGAVAMPAVAEDATTDRSFSAAIAPAEVCDGTQEAFVLVLTNHSRQQRLGSARVSVPLEVELSRDEDGADDLEVVVSRQRAPRTTPTVAYDAGARTIQLDDLSAAPGATVTISFTATATATVDADPRVEFTTQAKQANDFNSASDDANQLVLIGTQPATTIVTCGTLAFVTQPGDTSIGVPIPGADGTAGPRVAIVEDDGTVLEQATASITIGLAEDGDPAILAGTLTGATDNGVATFDDLTIDRAGSFELTASAQGYDGITSDAFEVFAFGTTCLPGEQCTTTLDGGRNGSTVLTGTAGDLPGALVGTSSDSNGAVEACGAVDQDGLPRDYDFEDFSYLPNAVTFGSTNLVDKVAEFRVSRQYDQRQTNNGVAFYQICATPLAPFTEFSTFVDLFGNTVVNPDDADNLALLDPAGVGGTFQTSGFLPDCSGPDDAPCVESRVKRNGGPVITVRWGSRWTMK